MAGYGKKRLTRPTSGIYLLDTKGINFSSSFPAAPPINLLDADYFLNNGRFCA
jgi:hypothetical protein